MEKNIDINLNKNGHPIIILKCFEDSTDLENNILKVFIETAIKKGIRIKPIVERNVIPDANGNSSYYEITSD